MAEIYNDVACTECGCVCDDLTLHVDNGSIASVQNACSLSEPRFLGQTDGCEFTIARVGNQTVDLDTAVQAAADLLTTSRAPLIYGLNSSSTPGVRAACQLADRIGATIDSASSTVRQATMVAMQSTGACTATLGEIRHRSDLIVYWGCDPLTTQPRHFERFVEAPGRFIPAGRSDRRIVVVDIKRTATAEVADQFIEIEPGTDFELLWALRSAIQGVTLHDEHVAGIPLKEMLALADHWKAARYGAFFFGPGLTKQGVPHANVEALLRMVQDLNAQTRAIAQPMPNTNGSAATENVLTWQTGYPLGVSFAGGFPRYNPGEYTAKKILEANEADAVVLVGSECVSQLTAKAQTNLRGIPTIVLDTPETNSDVHAAVEFTVGTYGIHQPGTAYRMDNVPIPLRKVFDSPLPSDAAVLNRIDAAFNAKQ